MHIKNKGFLPYLLPSFSGLVFFYIYPFIKSLKYSFFSYNFNSHFVGLDNILDLFGSPLFKNAMLNNAVFTLAVVPAVVLIAIFMASLVYNASSLSSFFRSSMIIPYVLPTAAMVLLWELFFDLSGYVNHILSWTGIEKIDWLGGSALRWPVIAMFIWKNSGFNTVLVLASMNTIEHEVLESARLDGAGRFRQLFNIVLPHITPVVFFVSILSVINSFRIFKETYLLGGKYPAETIYTVQHFINNQFLSMKYNYIVSASIIFTGFVILLVGVMYYMEYRTRKDG